MASTGKPYHHNKQCDLWYSYTGLPTCDSKPQATPTPKPKLIADTEFGKVSNMRTHEFKSHRMLYTRQCTKQLSTVGGGSRENSQWSDGQELARRAIRRGPRGQLAVQTGTVNEFVVDRFSLICLHNSHNDSVAAG